MRNGTLPDRGRRRVLRPRRRPRLETKPLGLSASEREALVAFLEARPTSRTALAWRRRPPSTTPRRPEPGDEDQVVAGVLLALAASAAVAVAALSAARAPAAASPDRLPALALLPPVPVPADNPMSAAEVEARAAAVLRCALSGDTSTSCATCHVAQMGWTHGDALAPGYRSHRLWRNNPTVLNAAHFRRLMWDGSLDRLEVQARSAMQAPVEGNGNAAIVEMRLRLVPEYVDRFRRGVRHRVAEARRCHNGDRGLRAHRGLRSAQGTRSTDSLAGDAKALTAAASAATRCSPARRAASPAITGAGDDESYHALGIPRQSVRLQRRWCRSRYAGRTRYAARRAARYRGAEEDLGRYYRTPRPADIGKFRTPSLRELRLYRPLHAQRRVRHAAGSSRLLRPRRRRRALISVAAPARSSQRRSATWSPPSSKSLSMDELLLVATPELPPMQPLVEDAAGPAGGTGCRRRGGMTNAGRLWNRFVMNPRGWWPLLAVLAIGVGSMLYMGTRTYLDAPPVPGFVDERNVGGARRSDHARAGGVPEVWADEHTTCSATAPAAGPDTPTRCADGARYGLHRRPPTASTWSALAAAQREDRAIAAMRLPIRSPSAPRTRLCRARDRASRGRCSAARAAKPSTLPASSPTKPSCATSRRSSSGARGCGVERPGKTYTYTHNWPYDELAGNRPSAQVMLWSVIAGLALVAALGAVLFLYGRYASVAGWRPAQGVPAGGGDGRRSGGRCVAPR
ncbi:MAG: cytochrome c peroxidase [Steroidobacteraceae bacterium]